MELITDFSELSYREFGVLIAENIQRNLGVDLLAIADSRSLDPHERLRLATDALLEGMANAPRLLPFFCDPGTAGTTDMLQELFVMARSIEKEPNIAFSEVDARIVRGYKGEELKEYVFTLIKRLENITNTGTVGTMVAELVGFGSLGLSIEAGIAAGRALLAGEVARNAIRAGINAITVKVFLVATAVLLAALVLWALICNPKQIVGLIFNDSDHDFVVKGLNGSDGGDLFLDSGQMSAFMEDNAEGLGSEKVQLNARWTFGAGDEDNVIFAGLYHAEKNFGLFGAEGVAVFTSTKSGVQIAHQFSVPYHADNGTATRIFGGKETLKELFDRLYAERRVDFSVVEGGFRLSSRVNDPRGGNVALVCSIEQMS